MVWKWGMGEEKSLLPSEEPAFGEAEQPKDLNSPLLARYMLHFSAPQQRKSPFNSTALNVTASGRPFPLRSFPMRLNSKEREYDKNRKKLNGEIFLPFYSVAQKRGSRKKTKKSCVEPLQQQQQQQQNTKTQWKRWKEKRGNRPGKVVQLGREVQRRGLRLAQGLLVCL